jgi:hypothetical protein
MDDDDKVVDLTRVRALRDFDGEDKLAYVEILWGERGAFAVNAVIRDLEALRRGTEDEEKPLRDPETTFEAEAILRRIRYVANHLADSWGLDHLVRPEDWEG